MFHDIFISQLDGKFSGKVGLPLFFRKFPENVPPEISELTTLVTDEKSERSHQRSQNQMDMRASLEKNAAPDV